MISNQIKEKFKKWAKLRGFDAKSAMSLYFQSTPGEKVKMVAEVDKYLAEIKKGKILPSVPKLTEKRKSIQYDTVHNDTGIIKKEEPTNTSSKIII